MGLASHGTLSGVLPVGTRFMNNQMHAAGLEVRSGAGICPFTATSSALATSGPLAFRCCSAGLQQFRWGEGIQVAILNEAAARLLFGTQDPIGPRIGAGRQAPEIEVIGLVEDASRVCVRGPSRRHISPSVAATDDVARQDAGESGFDLAHDRTGGAGAGRDTSSFPGPDDRRADRRRASTGTARGFAVRDVECAGHSDTQPLASMA